MKREDIKEGMIAVTASRLYVSKITQIKPMGIMAKMSANGYEYYLDIDKYNFFEHLIDCVETGDIVNGHQVSYISYDMQSGEKFLWLDSSNLSQLECMVFDKDIKTLTTKEQLEYEEYKNF